jgi:peptidoglycan hydrolase-like protein with peptidoglycan-binding domain
VSPRRRRRAVWVAAACGVTVLLVGGALLAIRPWQASTEAAPEREPVTAAVVKASLTDEVRLAGTLSYGDPIPLPAAVGMITVRPAAGQVVAIGQQIFEADGAPVVLFRGTRPFWRDLSVDSRDDEDIRQLEQNLHDLGFAPGPIDARYDWRTRQAVRDWQKSLGQEQTGTFSPSAVVVTEASGIRIAAATARAGEANVSPGTYTATALFATAKISADQAKQLTVGTPVIVTLPDGTDVEAALSTVDPGGKPDPTGAKSEDGQPKTTPPTATVLFADQKPVAAVGAAPVRITIRDGEEQESTLVVPATSLVATAEDAYAVEVYRDAEITRIPVTIGLVADSRVQILASGSDVEGGSGRALREGDLVVLAR